jgi:hypothetical protein
VTIRPLALCAVILLAVGATAEGKTYRAERYDSRVEVMRGGTVRVTETVALRFDDGTFTQFYREIPTRFTDGIEIDSASMDGTALTPGEGPGHFQLSGSSRVRVIWRFEPATSSTHVFELTYIVRGAIRQEGAADLLAWRLLPGEHEYPIGASTSTIELPAAPLPAPTMETHRVGSSEVTVDGPQVRIDARTIRANGWIEARVGLPRGSLIDRAPDWQERSFQVQRMSTRWIVISATVLLCGLVVLFGVRQGYDSPPRDSSAATWGSGLPENLPPAVAGALLTNGSPRLEHAMAALFSLAERGELTIEEQPRFIGRRQFTVARTPAGRPLAEHEQRALDIIFTGRHGVERSVSLAKARGRLVRHFRTFARTLEVEMAGAGLMDEGRRDVRKRFRLAAIVALIAAGATPGLAAFAVNDYGGWPMLIPLALVVVGVTALICYSAHTPLSNDAVRRAQTWRGFRNHLRDVARDRAAAPAEPTVDQMVPFAVAIGLAPAWASYLKHHRGSAPPWFRAVNAGDSGAFAAFVGAGGAGSGVAHGAGGGAAAGGGASGAS